jgi:hypothetical protein
VLDGRGVFLLAIAALCAVVLVDALLGSKAAIVGLLAVGPVVASFGATPRETAIVAVLALVVAVPLGLVVDDLSSGDLISRMAVVGVVGGLSIGIANATPPACRSSTASPACSPSPTL